MNGGPKWRQISKTLKNRIKITFCSNCKIFSWKFLSQCVISDKKIKIFRLVIGTLNLILFVANIMQVFPRELQAKPMM